MQEHVGKKLPGQEMTGIERPKRKILDDGIPQRRTAGKMQIAKEQFKKINSDIASKQEFYSRWKHRKARHARALVLLLWIPGQLQLRIKNDKLRVEDSDLGQTPIVEVSRH